MNLDGEGFGAEDFTTAAKYIVSPPEAASLKRCENSRRLANKPTSKTSGNVFGIFLKAKEFRGPIPGTRTLNCVSAIPI
jgi:hypothetical protein